MHAPGDVALGLAAFGMLAWWKLPPWLVVLLGAAAGAQTISRQSASARIPSIG